VTNHQQLILKWELTATSEILKKTISILILYGAMINIWGGNSWLLASGNW
jgi:hypothetical protein